MRHEATIPIPNQMERSLKEMSSDGPTSTTSGSLNEESVNMLLDDECFSPTDDDTTTSNESTSDLDVLDPLPRASAADTTNHCWSDPRASSFKIRGVNYLKDGKKVHSGPYLFPPRGADLFLTDDCPQDIGRSRSIFGGALRKVPTFIINFRFPWGVLVLYFEIPSKFVPFLRKRYSSSNDTNAVLPDVRSMSPSDKCACRFLMGTDTHKNNTLKLLPVVAEGPYVVRKMVTGKPAIIGNKLPVQYFYHPADSAKGLAEYLEADLDIGSSSKTAKTIVKVCKSYMRYITIDIGFVVQGDQEDELPEQMLGSVRLHGIDPDRSPMFSF